MMHFYNNLQQGQRQKVGKQYNLEVSQGARKPTGQIKSANVTYTTQESLSSHYCHDYG